eukprot:260431_1
MNPTESEPAHIQSHMGSCLGVKSGSEDVKEEDNKNYDVNNVSNEIESKVAETHNLNTEINNLNIDVNNDNAIDNSDSIDDNDSDSVGNYKNETGFGYFTERGRKLWIEAHPKEYKENKQYINTLQYNADKTKPLYFWQLYSLLGYSRINKIVSVFYKSIFDDKNAKNKWFRDAFVKIGPLQHHIGTQVAFWLDAFGAGKRYHGGEFRLDYHHRYNAHAVMTKNGAILWMEHMRNTLNLKTIDLTNDERVRPAINEFLQLMLNKYGHDFNFKTSEIEY